ncbi:hypothetical protein ABI_21750 [Asticcacaulis biprosthecium C19]|uniref:Uncharacterized protein n=1 Tax=Asticcacaulis biprosthecium C19 TaxID=715226 RepID=F4QGY0_9CAUL|nr:hypothetical protein [Asticcacaulis biprosthecium]EGF93733.1 hypothetical protein ABI_21750 [Asticcacaulis biprosthecium C19]
MPRKKRPPDIHALAQGYTADALKALADIMANGGSDASRVAAAKELLERGHGKAGQVVEAAKGKVVPPVIHYVIAGEEPPLGEGEYDTSVVDEESESDEPDFIVKDCE